MKAPRWIQNRLATRATMRRRVTDADRRAAAATRSAEALRKQLRATEEARHDARANYDMAVQVANEHGRTIGRVRKVLAEFDSTTSPTAVALAASVRRALDGEVETHE